MEFGIMFFSSSSLGGGERKGRYDLLLAAARFADRCGFVSVWVPERHFHEFGGVFPNPSVLAASLAMVTESLQIRAGSLVSPLHNTIRIAEDWSMIDNLSAGRVGISFGSGWNVEDFVLAPERYEKRHAILYEQIETVRSLWRGDEIVVENTFGKPTRIRIFPPPVQRELPVWVTSSGNVTTFESAGACGANVLTHLIGQDLAALGEKVERYRRALRARHGEGRKGTVTLMLHTFLGRDRKAVLEKVRAPFREYLRSAISLEQLAAQAGGVISGGHKIEAEEIPGQILEDLLDLTVDRYLREGSLVGTVDDGRQMIGRLREAGVDEVACMIDFVDDDAAVLESLGLLAELRSSCQMCLADPARDLAAHFLEELD